VTAVPLALADGLPTAGLETGAFEELWIGECLCQDGRVAEVFLPLSGQLPTGKREGLGGQIRFLSLVVEEDESPVLHDQLEALASLGNRPAYPRLAVL